MEKQRIPNPDPMHHENPFLAVENENLQNLEILLTSLAGEEESELHKISPAEWNHLQALEQRVWAAFFPASTPHYTAEHRMTMSRFQNTEQH